MKSKNMRYISALKLKGVVKRYQVRLFASTDYHPEVNKSFSPTEYGSLEAALVAAKAFRDAYTIKHAEFFESKRYSRRHIPETTTRTQSGYTGVKHKIDKKKLVNGGYCIGHYWVASWSEPNPDTTSKKKSRIKTKAFLFDPDNLLEEAIAKDKAIAYRKQKIEEQDRRTETYHRSNDKTLYQSQTKERQTTTQKGNRAMEIRDDISPAELRKGVKVRIESKQRAEAFFKHFSFNELNRILEACQTIKEEKEAEHLEQQKKVMELQAIAEKAYQAALATGATPDREQLYASFGAPKPQRNTGRDFDREKFKHRITDKNGLVRLFSGCGRANVQMKQVLTDKQLKNREFNSYKFEHNFQYKHAFKDTKGCITQEQLEKEYEMVFGRPLNPEQAAA